VAVSVSQCATDGPAARLRALEDLLIETVRPWADANPLSGEAGTDWYATFQHGEQPKLLVHLRGAEEKHAAELCERIESATAQKAAPSATFRVAPAAGETDAAETDAARFGGPAGLAVAERLWLSARADVLATIREHRSRARRMRAAADLLTASALAAGGPWPGAVQWLRGYTRSWAAEAGFPLADQVQARLAAEAGFVRNQADWLEQGRRVRAAAGTPNAIAEGAPHGVIARWFAWQSAAAGRLAQFDAAGRLSRSARDVHQALVHAVVHEQLGLSAADEAYLAWLLSLALTDDAPREPYFTDSAAAADRRYHEQSKYFVFRGEDQMADESLAAGQGRQRLRSLGRSIALPQAEPPARAPGLHEVLLSRRSTHGRYTGTFTLGELSTLLFYAAGAVSAAPLPGVSPTYRVRTYPSGGPNYPISLLLYCHSVESLDRGVYLYEAESHALEQLSDEDLSGLLQQTSPWFDPRVPAPKAKGKIEAAECPLWIFPVADLTHQRLSYGLRGYRLTLVECGHLAQNLSLVSTWLGRSCVGVGGYMDDAVNQILDVDGVNTSALYVYLVGDVESAA
jgi:SagB-type dehydrogenase family enzyme